jgi:hypothetical protein
MGLTGARIGDEAKKKIVVEKGKKIVLRLQFSSKGDTSYKLENIYYGQPKDVNAKLHGLYDPAEKMWWKQAVRIAQIRNLAQLPKELDMSVGYSQDAIAQGLQQAVAFTIPQVAPESRYFDVLGKAALKMVR